jgi:lipopolysaccharide/colanic/teichoic acid biosynthesis glycosyltransferase
MAQHVRSRQPSFGSSQVRCEGTTRRLLLRRAGYGDRVRSARSPDTSRASEPGERENPANIGGYPRPKWIFDKTVTLVLVVALLPVFAAVLGAMGLSMLLRREDRGPWLYREIRVSRGREFDLLKFRTLRSDVLESVVGEAHARLLEADASKLTWAARRFLKPWYLDELPQLWNVLRGDMSLVGPRPWPRSMVADQIASGFTYRVEFVAGWTGRAQVEKGVTEPEGYTDLDLEYLAAFRSSSALRIIRTDLSILWRTLVVMAKGEGLRF